MTETEYMQMLIGWLQIENEKLWHTRKLAWTILCGGFNTDLKRLPPNEQAWWPLMNDPRPKPVTLREIKRLDKKFRTTKWKPVINPKLVKAKVRQMARPNKKPYK